VARWHGWRSGVYGTLEGYLKAVDAKTGKELYKFKTPSGIIGNVMTYEHGGKQYVAVLSGVGGWAASVLRPVCCSLRTPAWHGAVDQASCRPRRNGRYRGPRAVVAMPVWRPTTSLGGTLTVFALPSE